MNSRFALAILVLLPFLLFAQSGTDSSSSFAGKYSARLILGANGSMMDNFGPYSDWEGKKPYDQKFLPGSMVGLSVHYHLFNLLKIGLGVQIANYGGSFFSNYGFGTHPPYFAQNQNNIYPRISENYRLSYVEIPMTVKVYLPSGSIRPFCEAGVSYARLQDAYFYVDNASNTSINFFIPKDLRTSIADLVEKNNWNYLLSAGLDFRANKKVDLQLVFRFSNSLTRVFAYEFVEVYDQETNKLLKTYDMVTHMRSVQILVSTGYNF